MLAEAGVGSRHDRDFGNLGERGDRRFDLGRRDVLAAPNDDVVHAVGDGEEAVGIEHAHVAGAIPTVGVEHGRGEVGIRVTRAEVGAS